VGSGVIDRLGGVDVYGTSEGSESGATVGDVARVGVNVANGLDALYGGFC